MVTTLSDLRPVYVAGIGFHRYQRLSDDSFVQLGLTAVREALNDSGIAWPEVDQAFTGTATIGMAVSRPILTHLGATGIGMTQVENASASGSTAVRMAATAVASGTSDVSLALGVDKRIKFVNAVELTGVESLVDGRMNFATHFALLASEYMDLHGATPEELAAVAVKNHSNGALNPNAQRQKERSLDEVLGDKSIAGPLTRLQCCPVGEGAAAVLIVSDDAIERLGLDRSRCVQIVSSALTSQTMYTDENRDVELTRVTTEQAIQQAGISPTQLDVVEVHDAFSIEELQYVEAIGLCGEGEAGRETLAGSFDIGGRTAVSPSGGLLAMGHPNGPTGVGQIGEIARQLRGEAGPRQQPNAGYGLAHMVGLGAVCAAHVLKAPEVH